MRIAIVQMPMSWTVEENTRSIVEYLAEAKTRGADVAVFPECATTGFHRRVPEQTSRSGIQQAIRRIQTQCAALELPALFGTPFFSTAESSLIWNAAVVIGCLGEVLAVSPKVGLTKSEHTFFHAGSARPVFTLGSVSCAVLLCREVRDAEHVRSSLSGVRVVFWPGAIAWDSGRATDPENMVTRDIASGCARTLGTYLVQCNWPHSLNDPAVKGMGKSLVIAPTGEVIHECAVDQPGISLVTLDLSNIEPNSSSVAA